MTIARTLVRCAVSQNYSGLFRHNTPNCTLKIENNKFCHAELVSASFKRAVFTFNPKNSGLDYFTHGYLDPETSSG